MKSFILGDSAHGVKTNMQIGCSFIRLALQNQFEHFPKNWDRDADNMYKDAEMVKQLIIEDDNGNEKDFSGDWMDAFVDLLEGRLFFDEKQELVSLEFVDGDLWVMSEEEMFCEGHGIVSNTHACEY